MSAPGVLADFHAASRDALENTRHRLSESTAQAGSGDLDTVTDQLDAVADVLTREPVLRRTLADSSRSVEDREGLADRLFGQQVTTATADVVRAAVSSSWSRAEDLVTALRTVAREALLVSAERDGRLDAVEDELFRLGRIVGAEPDLERLLADPTADADGKQRVLERLLADRAEPTTRKLAAQLVAHPVGRSIAQGLERLAELAAERRERSVATVRSPIALSEQQQERLAGALTRIYRRDITLHLEVDPRIVGGLVIQVGDEVIDGSVAGRLDELGRRLG
ncbi:F0F1 ATP synthase subunit delta [Actinomycetospora cinnamomea]|uniref:ATP synthase subunit delta n=1 Tax=Actinomycetospora cinnamomea TaxID=663609 RepID=A0A2U1FRF8_9PSEU|nr:F0F1 ATP synthase subunit delta [Actinomycetospora cinnamomea]PVZ14734.1 ATP synthase F1 subcomplex delta subunit [Actinomycetospora cinnamomea]